MIIAGLFLTVMLGAIAVIDWRTHRIPDRLSLPLLAAGLVWNYLSGDAPFSAYLIGAALGYASLATFGWLYFRARKREGLGLGDAKLFAAAGAWLGWQALPFVLLAASSAALLFAVSTRRPTSELGGREIAFGPWFSLAIWLIWILDR